MQYSLTVLCMSTLQVNYFAINFSFFFPRLFIVGIVLVINVSTTKNKNRQLVVYISVYVCVCVCVSVYIKQNSKNRSNFQVLTTQLFSVIMVP